MKNIVEISVPNHNDSLSRVVLDGVQYQVRFSWNEAAGRWSFGLYTMQKEPIVVGIKLVPRFPLNLQVVDERMPGGVFGVYSGNDAVGRGDFVSGAAAFGYIPGGGCSGDEGRDRHNT